MTNSKLSKTPSFTLTSTPIFPPEPPNSTCALKCNPKTTQTFCPYFSSPSSTKPYSHLPLQSLFYTILIFILFGTSFRLVYSLPSFSSKIYLSKVPVTAPTTTNLRSRRQLHSAIALSTETPKLSAALVGVTASSGTTSTPSSFTPTCNFTEYPLSGCSPLFNATCDRETGVCICGPSTSDEVDHGHQKGSQFETGRHRKRFCLNEAPLGSACQSSGQCRATDPLSGCFSTTSGHFANWKCSCTPGFVEHAGSCQADPKLASIENPYSRCTAVGKVYISILDRCVDSALMPFYANRGAGRAGGGRGGGGRGRGGVGSRATGSRSWYTSDRNLMRRRSAANRPKFWLSLVITLIYIVLSSL